MSLRRPGANRRKIRGFARSEPRVIITQSALLFETQDGSVIVAQGN